MASLDGKVALITGAARGQGRAEAERFVAEGARVMLADVLDDLGAAVVSNVGPAAAYEHLDVCDATQWQYAVRAAVDRFGRLDVLVNNAGVYPSLPLEDTDEALFRRTLEVNLVGAFLGIRAVLPHLSERGGSIINVSSANGMRGARQAAAYASSKFGLRGLTRSAAIELGPRASGSTRSSLASRERR